MDTHVLLTSREAFVLNRWVQDNFGWFLWVILTGATLLQQFPTTEPAVAGFFWISVITFFVGAIVGSGWRTNDPIGVYANVIVQILGIALQIYILIVHWDTLVWLDEGLRTFRTTLVKPLGQDHLFPLRLVWALFTIDFFWRRWKRGFLFYPLARQPW